ncbi:hypothetical protein SK128_017278, partial [Halocaridina rubra]
MTPRLFLENEKENCGHTLQVIGCSFEGKKRVGDVYILSTSTERERTQLIDIQQPVYPEPSAADTKEEYLFFVVMV